jgi:NaMN:DMB phosphoribosyltransferase
LFMGGLMLLQVAAMVYGIKAAPEWVRLAGAIVCVACGVLSAFLGLQRQFGKKPEPAKKVVLKRERASEETAAKGSRKKQD